MKWTIVAFDHPNIKNSVLYRQKLTTKGLLKAIENAIKLGANLMSIRGFSESDNTVPFVTGQLGGIITFGELQEGKHRTVKPEGLLIEA